MRADRRGSQPGGEKIALVVFECARSLAGDQFFFA
jgi:hypothetical protein